MDRHRGIKPFTCNYWKIGSCFKKDRCDFLHGYVCRDDGKCVNQYCNKSHFRQRSPASYLKGRRYLPYGNYKKYSRRSRSYDRRSRSGSSRRYSRSPRGRSRSPYGSPRGRSRSPYGSPKRRSRSPYGSPKKRSRSPYGSPKRRSRSPYGSSKRRSRSPYGSPRGRSHSPYRRKYSRSPYGSPRKGSRSPRRSRSQKRSPYRSPKQKNRSRSSSSSKSSKKSLERNTDKKDSDKKEIDSIPDIYSNLDEKESTENKELQAEIMREMYEENVEESREKEMSPSQKSFQEFLNITKKKSEDLDQKAFQEAFFKALNKSENNSMEPPKTDHSSKLNAENLAKPFQDNLFGDSKQEFSHPMWTPALSNGKRQTSTAVSSHQPLSNWEIDTPYVTRNKQPSELPLSQATSSSSKDKLSVVPKEESSKKQKKRHRHQRKLSSSSSSSSSGSDSSSDDEKLSKKKNESSQKPVEMSEKDKEEAMQKKKDILSRVWTLMGQKKKLEIQKDDIARTHKGDSKSLAMMLHENNSLSAEIDKQIFHMNHLVQLINDKLGISKTENQQQEFYVHSKMYSNETELPKLFSKPHKPLVAMKTFDKFIKSAEDIDKNKGGPIQASPSPPPPIKKSKKKDRSRSGSRDKKAKKEETKREKSKKTKRESPPNKKPYRSPSPKKIKLEQASEYSPSPAMKPNIKYIDQGMHWCKICNDFLDTLGDYIDHLHSDFHLKNLKYDDKKWLPKIKKEPETTVLVGAPVLTIPLKGLEFTHSLTGYYCSLCDTFLKHKDEAKCHTETKIHVTKYKEYLSANPLYETNYIKEKMAAYAKFIVEKERLKERSNTLEKTDQEVFFSEVKKDTGTNLSKNCPEEEKSAKMALKPEPKMTSKPDSTTEEYSKKRQDEYESRKYKESNASIRVSSRDRGHSKDKLMDIPLPRSSHKSSKTTEEFEDKMKSLKKKLLEKINDKDYVKPREDSPDDKDEDSSKTPSSKKITNVMIGKMPFLKRNKPNKNEEKSLKKGKENNEKPVTHISNVFPSFEDDDISSSALPACVPDNVEYITEIQSLGKEQTFVKKYGPMKIDEEINKIAEDKHISSEDKDNSTEDKDISPKVNEDDVDISLDKTLTFSPPKNILTFPFANIEIPTPPKFGIINSETEINTLSCEFGPVLTGEFETIEPDESEPPPPGTEDSIELKTFDYDESANNTSSTIVPITIIDDGPDSVVQEGLELLEFADATDSTF